MYSMNELVLQRDKDGIRIDLTTLDAVPPGQQPSNIKPTETEGARPKNLLMNNPKAGIIVY